MSLQIATLTKTFDEQTAVDAISFSLVKGEIVGFLGPNGSGKTTTMKCICGILPPSSGQVKVAGTDVQEQPLEVKKILGYLPEHNPLPTDMYVVEYRITSYNVCYTKLLRSCILRPIIWVYPFLVRLRIV